MTSKKSLIRTLEQLEVEWTEFSQNNQCSPPSRFGEVNLSHFFETKDTLKGTRRKVQPRGLGMYWRLQALASAYELKKHDLQRILDERLTKVDSFLRCIGRLSEAHEIRLSSHLSSLGVDGDAFFNKYYNDWTSFYSEFVVEILRLKQLDRPKTQIRGLLERKFFLNKERKELLNNIENFLGMRKRVSTSIGSRVFAISSDDEWASRALFWELSKRCLKNRTIDNDSILDRFDRPWLYIGKEHRRSEQLAKCIHRFFFPRTDHFSVNLPFRLMLEQILMASRVYPCVIICDGFERGKTNLPSDFSRYVRDRSSERILNALSIDRLSKCLLIVVGRGEPKWLEANHLLFQGKYFKMPNPSIDHIKSIARQNELDDKFIRVLPRIGKIPSNLQLRLADTAFRLSPRSSIQIKKALISEKYCELIEIVHDSTGHHSCFKWQRLLLLLLLISEYGLPPAHLSKFIKQYWGKRRKNFDKPPDNETILKYLHDCFGKIIDKEYKNDEPFLTVHPDIRSSSVRLFEKRYANLEGHDVHLAHRLLAAYAYERALNERLESGSDFGKESFSYSWDAYYLHHQLASISPVPKISANNQDVKREWHDPLEPNSDDEAVVRSCYRHLYIEMERSSDNRFSLINDLGALDLKLAILECWFRLGKARLTQEPHDARSALKQYVLPSILPPEAQAELVVSLGVAGLYKRDRAVRRRSMELASELNRMAGEQLSHATKAKFLKLEVDYLIDEEKAADAMEEIEDFIQDLVGKTDITSSLGSINFNEIPIDTLSALASILPWLTDAMLLSSGDCCLEEALCLAKFCVAADQAISLRTARIEAYRSVLTGDGGRRLQRLLLFYYKLGKNKSERLHARELAHDLLLQSERRLARMLSERVSIAIDRARYLRVVDSNAMEAAALLKKSERFLDAPRLRPSVHAEFEREKALSNLTNDPDEAKRSVVLLMRIEAAFSRFFRSDANIIEARLDGIRGSRDLSRMVEAHSYGLGRTVVQNLDRIETLPL